MLRHDPTCSAFASPARHSRESGNPALALTLTGESESKSFHSSCGRAGYFLLLVQEKVTKENTPREPRSQLRCEFARSCRGSLDGHPCPFANSRASCARPYGRIRHTLAAADGDPRSQAKAKAEPRVERLLLALASARTTRAAPASPGPHYIAATADDQARRVRARIARIPLLHTDVQLAEPGRCRGPYGQDAHRAQCSGAASFGYFSSLLKKSNPLARRASGSSALQTPKSQSKVAGSPPKARGDDEPEQNGTPASTETPPRNETEKADSSEPHE